MVSLLTKSTNRFGYKNPKKPMSRGSTAMQSTPFLGSDTGTTVWLIKGMGAASEPRGMLSNEAFWKKKVEEVPVNQVGDIHLNLVLHLIDL